LDIELSKGTLFIKVTNSFDGEIKYAMGKNGDPSRIISQKKGGGFGLKNIRGCVEKYDGVMKITHGDGVFSVVVMVYV